MNEFYARNLEEWHAWLEEHYQTCNEVWLLFYKAGSGKPSLDYEESVEEALCFGWIDSKPNSLDDERSMLWFAPRKAGTGWSRLNKGRVERLIAEGRMTAAGMEKVEAAKQDGSWSVLDKVEELEIPPDLAAALAQYDAATQNFDAFPRSVKRGILEWIGNARKPETRAKRVAETARLAQNNIRANQWRQ